VLAAVHRCVSVQVDSGSRACSIVPKTRSGRLMCVSVSIGKPSRTEHSGPCLKKHPVSGQRQSAPSLPGSRRRGGWAECFDAARTTCIESRECSRETGSRGDRLPAQQKAYRTGL